MHEALWLLFYVEMEKEYSKDDAFAEVQNRGLVEKPSTNPVLYRQREQMLSDVWSVK